MRTIKDYPVVSFVTKGSKNILVRSEEIVAADFSKGEIILYGGVIISGLRLGQYEYELLKDLLSGGGDNEH